jgi:L-seryl-tRNA(Ser) seleniumtransferase
MITCPIDDIESKAKKLAKLLQQIGHTRLTTRCVNTFSKVGGGALPLLSIASIGVSVDIKGLTPNTLEKQMRDNDIPVIGRIEADIFVMDMRTVQNDELVLIKNAIEKVLDNDR